MIKIKWSQLKKKDRREGKTDGRKKFGYRTQSKYFIGRLDFKMMSAILRWAATEKHLHRTPNQGLTIYSLFFLLPNSIDHLFYQTTHSATNETPTILSLLSLTKVNSIVAAWFRQERKNMNRSS